ncbi:MAG: hypothetical protein WBA83_02340 [Burkholderiaceae bacterium]
MTKQRKNSNPPRQDPEQGNAVDPRNKEPAGPGQYLSGVDEPGRPSKKNPGQANPAHNTPGQIRRDEPGQHDTGLPEQAQTQSYPGIKGPKTHALEEDEAINKKTPGDNQG